MFENYKFIINIFYYIKQIKFPLTFLYNIILLMLKYKNLKYFIKISKKLHKETL